MKSRFRKRLAATQTLIPGRPEDNPGYDPGSFRLYEQALTERGFLKLGEGQLAPHDQLFIPNFFAFFSNTSRSSNAVVRQVFPPRRSATGVQISIGTRMEDGSRILTRSAETFSALKPPRELVEIYAGASPDECIEKHFQRLSAFDQTKMLPAPVTLDEALQLVNERHLHQEKAMRRKSWLSVAVSYQRWRNMRGSS